MEDEPDGGIEDGSIDEEELLAELDNMEGDVPIGTARRLHKEVQSLKNECSALVQQGEKQQALPVLKQMKIKEKELKAHLEKHPSISLD